MFFDKNRLFLLITGLIALCSTTLAQTNDIEQLQKELNACRNSRPNIVAIAKEARQQLKECETQREESQKLAQQEMERLKAQYEAALQQERRLKAQLEAQLKALRQRVAEAEREVKRLKTQSLKNQPKPVVVPQPSQPDEFAPGKIFRDRLADGSFGPEMVWIPAGSFRMGDIQGGGHSNEKPVHRVSVGRFAMGKYEVTFAEYDKFAEATGRTKPDDEGWGRGNRPVINVSWYDATAYAEWLSQQTGKQYRLPTEAEWEYAARAGTTTKYWWGNTASHEYANYGADECCSGLAKGKDRWKSTAPVGSFEPNPFDLYDTAGNVWEWTCSEYSSSYDGSEKSCEEHVSLGVIRGGSWGAGPGVMRVTGRSRSSDGFRYDDVGFRLARP